MTILNKASERLFGSQTVVDVDAASPRLRRHIVTVPSAAFTQNSTTRGAGFVVPFPMRLVAAHVAYETVPAGGTLSARIVSYDESANAAVNLTDTTDPETLVAREGRALTLATTNVTLEANDVVQLQTVADNVTVTQAGAGGVATLVFEPIEETAIDV